jgi:triosephosphate isomerase (TIM)
LRRTVIAGNWKMYKTATETRAFFRTFQPLVSSSRHCDILIAPPFTALAAAVECARDGPIGIAAQNVYWEREGAYTGEISGRMLVDAGCRAVIIGHSERRQWFGETDDSVNRKVKAALEVGLTPIVCVGELLAEREKDLTRAVLKRQFEGGLAALTPAEFSRILMAYEPVWAIGTGRTATPEIASEAQGYLRALAAARFTPELAAALRILYGGSVKPENIQGLMAQDQIDGALVGGASLEPKSFAAIVNFSGSVER